MTISIQSIEGWPYYDTPKSHVTTYCGTQTELIEAGIVPPDFFSFRGRARNCRRRWYGKKIPSAYSFPDGVEHIWAEKRGGGMWSVRIEHKLDSPPHVPPGETWQRPKVREKPKDAFLSCLLNDTDTAAPRIGTGSFPLDENFTVSFSGTREQLINSGIATSAMFPMGTTPTGKVRDQKSSGKRSPTAWHVSRAREGGLWRVHFYGVKPEESNAA